MKEIAPLRLYKYQPCNNYAFDNLSGKCLWFSKPESFNDPFDCDINFTIVDDTDENLQSLFVRMLALAPDKKTFRSKYTNKGKTNEEFRNDIVIMARVATKSIITTRQFGISCFSEDNENILMWSHYASSHKGFCLEFDTNFAPFKPVKTQALLKVYYSEKYPPLSVNDIPNTLPSITQTIFGTKSPHWMYEKEWRLFASPGNRAYSFDTSALLGVYLGHKMEESDKHKIEKILVNFPDVKRYQMQKSKSEFKIFSQEIP